MKAIISISLALCTVLTGCLPPPPLRPAYGPGYGGYGYGGYGGYGYGGYGSGYYNRRYPYRPAVDPLYAPGVRRPYRPGFAAGPGGPIVGTRRVGPVGRPGVAVGRSGGGGIRPGTAGVRPGGARGGAARPGQAAPGAAKPAPGKPGQRQGQGQGGVPPV